MALSKDVIMQNMQRFGGAMYTPVILFAFFGLTVAVSIVCKNTGLLGAIVAVPLVSVLWSVYSELHIKDAPVVGELPAYSSGKSA